MGGSVHGPKQPNCLRLVDLFVSEPPRSDYKKNKTSLSDIIWLVEEHFEAQGRGFNDRNNGSTPESRINSSSERGGGAASHCSFKFNSIFVKKKNLNGADFWICRNLHEICMANHPIPEIVDLPVIWRVENLIIAFEWRALTAHFQTKRNKEEIQRRTLAGKKRSNLHAICITQDLRTYKMPEKKQQECGHFST